MKAIELVLAVSVCVPGLSQTGIIMSGSASSKNVHFSYETRLDPPSPPLTGLGGGGAVVGPSGTHRYMTDSSARRIFGYDIEIELLKQADSYKVTFSPLSLAPEKVVGDSAGWTVTTIPGPKTAKTVPRGYVIAFHLFTHPGTGQTIDEYLRIGEWESRGVPVAGLPRDFSVQDVELRITKPLMTVNGKPEWSASAVGSVSGAWLWFYLPDRGRYFLSILPRPEFGFSKAGEIRGSSLSFTIGGDAINNDGEFQHLCRACSNDQRLVQGSSQEDIVVGQGDPHAFFNRKT